MADIPATLSDQIANANSLEISYRTLHKPFAIYNEQTDEYIELPFSSLTNKYRSYLLACVMPVQLTDKEKEKYKYSPKKLSYDLYGTTELWADLLKLNKCASVIEFEPNYIRVYDPARFKSFLNEVMIFDDSVRY